MRPDCSVFIFLEVFENVPEENYRDARKKHGDVDELIFAPPDVFRSLLQERKGYPLEAGLSESIDQRHFLED